ncbi:MAG TPA: DMT family transporter [Bosea sp. (in: a-proteobacteria)]|jgi:drug/metabolite transporter (DMT)-like permease|uniref:DMT family transporter n=1 Tax=Bosea sp. (in: a-proteobacteria) TaxID=1871050 RepID=UPI002E10E50D|nr:DMT family transporter [Bosea sp. (in: a-proteobacteria)]
MPSHRDLPRPESGSPRLRGFLWAGLAVAIFAGWFVVTRFSVTRTLNVWDLTALRYGIGAILLAPVLLRRLPPRAWRNGFVFAALWGAPFAILVAFGVQMTTAGRAAAVTPTLMPVFAGLLGWLLLHEQPGRIRLAGYGAIAAGLCGLVLTAGSAQGAPSLLGLGLLVLAAVMWASYTLILRRSGLTPIQSAALICFWSAVIFVPVYIGLGLSHLGQAPAAEIAIQSFYQGVLMSTVALISFNRGVALLGASAGAAMIALVPVAASLLAIVFLREIPDMAEGISIALIVGGVLLAARAPRQQAR